MRRNWRRRLHYRIGAPTAMPRPADNSTRRGGGNQICGMYDINPNKFGQINNLVTFASDYGTERDVYNGIDLNALYGERLNQIDFRLAKTIRIGRAHVDAAMDVYNLSNASTVLSLNTRYGPSWLAPTQILPGRMFKFGGQLNF